MLIWEKCYRSVYAIKPLCFSADYLCSFKVQFVRQVMHLKAVCFFCLTATQLFWTLGTRWRFSYGFAFWMTIKMKLIPAGIPRTVEAGEVLGDGVLQPTSSGRTTVQEHTKQRQENSRKCSANASETWENKGTASEPRYWKYECKQLLELSGCELTLFAASCQDQK